MIKILFILGLNNNKMKECINHNISGAAEALFIPLWARAQETIQKNPIIRDEKAHEIISKVSCDFSKLKNAQASQVGIAVRTMLLDRAVGEFIKKNPEAVIVNLGAGLDTRFNRMDNGKITWYDIDLPEVMEIRKNYFTESGRRKIISKSVLDYSWIDEVEYSGKPVLLIAEGLLMYFDEIDVMEIMINLADAFPKAEMLFEISYPLIAKNSSKHDSVSKTNAQFKWGECDGRNVADIYYKIKFIDQWNYFDYHKARWRWMRFFTLTPWLKKKFNSHIVHVRFLQYDD